MSENRKRQKTLDGFFAAPKRKKSSDLYVNENIDPLISKIVKGNKLMNDSNDNIEFLNEVKNLKFGESQTADSVASSSNFSKEDAMTDCVKPGNCNDSFDISFDSNELLDDHNIHSDVHRFTVKCCVSLQHCKRITLLGNDFECALELYERWNEETVLKAGFTIHIIGSEPLNNPIILKNDSSIILIVEPDILISATHIVGAIQCLRRSFFSIIFKLQEVALPMVLGNILHQLFQTCLMHSKCDERFLKSNLDKICAQHAIADNLFLLKLSKFDIQKIIFEQYANSLRKLVNIFCRDGFNSDDVAIGPGSDFRNVERNFWSRKLGMRGKIDLLAVKENVKTIFEFKSGRHTLSIEHQGQIRLYLMVLDSIVSNAGYLVYLKDGSLHPVAPGHLHARELVILRNKLAAHLYMIKNETAVFNDCFDVPPLQENLRICSSCSYLQHCGLTSLYIDDVTPTLANTLHQDSVRLPQSHHQYFTKFLKLIWKEGQREYPAYASIWKSPLSERVANCLTLPNLTLESCVEMELGTFRLKFFSSTPVDLFLNEADRVYISSQCLSHLVVATGQIDFSDTLNKNCVIVIAESTLSMLPEVRQWRLDKYEYGNDSSLALMSSNLVSLMSPSHTKLRSLIIDRCVPEFEPTDKDLIPLEKRANAKSILRGLNSEQKHACRKALMCRDYTVIQGMPGCGKTTVLVAIIRLFLLRNYSIIFSSYTNAAVDNVLCKLNDFDVPFLRFGNRNRCHPSIREHCVSEVPTDFLCHKYKTVDVIAFTCLSIPSSIFAHRNFNVCIIDESSQILQPLAIGTLFYTKRFILVGDSQQLAPLVSNPDARDDGLGESLLERLSCVSNSSCMLRMQYRSHKDIMDLSNTLVYDKIGASMVCGNKNIVDCCPKLSIQDNYPTWIFHCLDNDSHVVLVNTSAINSSMDESIMAKSRANRTEIRIVQLLVSSLKESGWAYADIGVIAPFRYHISLLRQLLPTAVEVDTVDKFQGRDKPIILFSSVRASGSALIPSPNELLCDVRRVNVAISRAKFKLIIIGHLPTLCAYPPMKIISDHCQKHNFVINAAI